VTVSRRGWLSGDAVGPGPSSGVGAAQASSAALHFASAPEVRDPLGVAGPLGLRPPKQISSSPSGPASNERTTEGATRRTSHVSRSTSSSSSFAWPEPATTNVDLLLLAMPVAERHARARLVGEAADAELGRVQGVAGHLPLHWRFAGAHVAQALEVLLRPVGHGGLGARRPRQPGPPSSTASRAGWRHARQALTNRARLDGLLMLQSSTSSSRASSAASGRARHRRLARRRARPRPAARRPARRRGAGGGSTRRGGNRGRVDAGGGPSAHRRRGGRPPRWRRGLRRGRHRSD
jgi:hypothetical protein